MVTVAGVRESAVRSTCSTKARPPIEWRTLGSDDFIRVPWPAARITIWMSVIGLAVIRQNLAPLDRCVDFSSRQLVLPGDGRERHPAPKPLRFCQMAKFNRQRLVVGSQWRGKCPCGRADNYCEFT